MITITNEVARPFLPTKDFEVSCAFYESLGFKKVFDGQVAIFEVGATSFILQRGYDKTWAENTMLQLMVDDLGALLGELGGEHLRAHLDPRVQRPHELRRVLVGQGGGRRLGGERLLHRL